MKQTVRYCWSWLTASRGRFSLVCVIALFGLLLWSRLILVSNIPRTAVAGDEDEQRSAVDDRGELQHAPGAPQESQSSDKDTSHGTQESTPSGPNSVPLTHGSESVSKTSSDDWLIREEGKFESQGTEKSTQEDNRNQQQKIRSAIGNLRLESVMHDQLMAVLNEKSYRVGSIIRVAGFESLRIELLEIRSQSVILNCEGRRFEMRTKQPH